MSRDNGNRKPILFDYIQLIESIEVVEEMLEATKDAVRQVIFLADGYGGEVKDTVVNALDWHLLRSLDELAVKEDLPGSVANIKKFLVEHKKRINYE